jgi:hypothetical protein
MPPCVTHPSPLPHWLDTHIGPNPLEVSLEFKLRMKEVIAMDAPPGKSSTRRAQCKSCRAAEKNLEDGGQDAVELGLRHGQLGQGRVLVLLAEGQVQVLDLLKGRGAKEG